MADSPKIYLHIGHGKVASSTIQNLLCSNADEIRRQGLLIADVNFEFPRAGPVRGYPFKALLDWMLNPEDRTKKLSEALLRVGETCRTGGYRGVIISSEMLSSREAATWFRESAGDVPLRAIYYLRRQDGWLESAWKQGGLKDGTSLSEFVDLSLKTGAPAYLRAARAWRDAADHLTVRPIEGVEDIQAHFSGWCGLEFGRLQPVERANRTFDWALLDLLSRNPFLFEDRDDNRLFNFLEYLLPDDAPRDGHGMITADQADRIWSTFEAENRELRREFFPDLPACDWDRPPNPQTASGRMEQFGTNDSIFRNLAIELMILRNLHKKLPAGGKVNDRLEALDEKADRIGQSITRRFDRLRSRLEREEARRLAFEKRLEQLESRSIGRLISERLVKLRARWRNKSGLKRPESETGPEDL